MNHIGFTGTRHGMTDAQRTKVRELVEGFAKQGLGTAHHGDCVGSDEEFHKIADTCGLDLEGHPPLDSSLRAFCSFDTERAPSEFLVRNRCIVDACAVVIATPFEALEQQRGGTWSTIRYARRTRKARVVLPDGTVTT